MKRMITSLGRGEVLQLQRLGKLPVGVEVLVFHNIHIINIITIFIIVKPSSDRLVVKFAAYGGGGEVRSLLFLLLVLLLLFRLHYYCCCYCHSYHYIINPTLWEKATYMTPEAIAISMQMRKFCS